MSQSALVLDSGVSGDALTQDIADALQSVSTWYYGPTDPTTLGGGHLTLSPGFAWFDSSVTPAILKLYQVNGTWVEWTKLDGTPGSVLLGLLNGKVALGAGGTSNGEVNQLGLNARIRSHASYTPSDNTDFATKLYVDNVSRPDSVAFFVAGVLAQSDGYAARLIDRPGSLTAIRVRVNTAPVGADLRIRISRQPSGSDTPNANQEVAVPAGQKQASLTLGSPMALIALDMIRLDVTQVGTTTPGGSNLHVVCTIDP